jgi:hypothetical protein
MWDSSAEQCEQPQVEDWTGVDSLAAPLSGLVVFVIVQFLERNGPLINFAPDGLFAGYLKDSQKAAKELQDEDVTEKHFDDDPTAA